MDVTVPAGTPTGSYALTVTATDGSRQRSSAFPVTVDALPPTTTVPVLSLHTGTVLGSAMASGATWAAAVDEGGVIDRYEVMWGVDSTPGATISLSAGTRSVARTMAVGHSYTLGLRARDAAGNWSPWVQSAPFRPLVSQDTSKSVVHTGAWTRYYGAWMSGGTSLYSRSRGASVSRSFTGRAIALVASRSPNRGKATIYIDGARAATIDLYRSSAQHRALVFTGAWASAGPHTLRLVVAGTPGRPRVDVDAFVIVP
jgi:hypothetical protein